MSNELKKQSETKPADTAQTGGLVVSMAAKFGMDRTQFWKTLAATIMPDKVQPSTEQTMAFLAVASEYDLNPFTKEIYAFPAKGGGIQPIVSIDGWMKLANTHPQYNGVKFIDTLDDKGGLVSITCQIHRSDRDHPIETTEYMIECKRDTEPWKKWPRRMLRHKAFIQCARLAFGFAGIADPDEAERIREAMDVTPPLTIVKDPRAPSSAEAVAAKLGVGVMPKMETADELEARTTALREDLIAALERKVGPAAAETLFASMTDKKIGDIGATALEEWIIEVNELTAEDAAEKVKAKRGS